MTHLEGLKFVLFATCCGAALSLLLQLVIGN